jgi:hypothetical protein
MSKPPLWKIIGPAFVFIPYCAWVLNDRFTNDYVLRDMKKEQRRAEIAANAYEKAMAEREATKEK